MRVWATSSAITSAIVETRKRWVRGRRRTWPRSTQRTRSRRGRTAARRAAACRGPSSAFAAITHGDGDRERHERQRRRRVAQLVEHARRAVGDAAEKTRYPTAIALIVAISTAPAATSFASFAIGSNEVVATSIAPSIARVDHLRDQHERDRDQQRDQLDLLDADREREHEHRRRDRRSGSACSAACGARG